MITPLSLESVVKRYHVIIIPAPIGRDCKRNPHGGRFTWSSPYYLFFIFYCCWARISSNFNFLWIAALTLNINQRMPATLMNYYNYYSPQFLIREKKGKEGKSTKFAIIQRNIIIIIYKVNLSLNFTATSTASPSVIKDQFLPISPTTKLNFVTCGLANDRATWLFLEDNLTELLR